MKKGKYLKFYEKCMETGYMPYKETDKIAGGLCSCFPKNKKLSLFKPDDCHDWYWGYGYDFFSCYAFEVDDVETTFTPLRQTIVLFLAAMNREL